MQVGRLEPVPARRVRELDGIGPGTVLRGLTAEPGLVVLSGAWLDGGLVIARDPLRTADGTGLDDVFAAPAAPAPGRGRRPAGRRLVRLAGVSRTRRGAARALRLVPERRALGPPHPHLVGRGSALRRRRSPAGARPSTYRRAAVRRLDRRRHALRATCCAPPSRLRDVGMACTPDTTRAAYTAAVERCIARIRDGDVYQANICLQLAATFDGDAAAVFAALVAALQPAHAALVCGPDRRSSARRPSCSCAASGPTSRRRRSRAPGHGSGRPPSTATRPGCATRPRSGPRT